MSEHSGLQQAKHKLDGIQRFLDGIVQSRGVGQTQFDACNEVREALGRLKRGSWLPMDTYDQFKHGIVVDLYADGMRWTDCVFYAEEDLWLTLTRHKKIKKPEHFRKVPCPPLKEIK